MNNEQDDHRDPVPATTRRSPVTRVPAGSFFYEKVVPAILLTLAIVTIVLAIIALAVILDIIPHG